MSDFFAKHLVIDICMSINVDQSDWPMLFGNSLKNWVCNRVVATHCEGYDVMYQQVVIIFSDSSHAVFQVKCVDCYIADITDLHHVEWLCTCRHVERAQHA